MPRAWPEERNGTPVEQRLLRAGIIGVPDGSLSLGVRGRPPGLVAAAGPLALLASVGRWANAPSRSCIRLATWLLSL